MLGICLDLELRLRSAAHGQRGSLAGLFRRLMMSHGGAGTGLTQADIVAAASAEAGEPMAEFFARHVDGTAELPLPELLPRLGVRVISETTSKAHSGLVLTADRGVRNIDRDSWQERAKTHLFRSKRSAAAGTRAFRCSAHTPRQKGGDFKLGSTVLALALGHFGH